MTDMSGMVAMGDIPADSGPVSWYPVYLRVFHLHKILDNCKEEYKICNSLLLAKTEMDGRYSLPLKFIFSYCARASLRTRLGGRWCRWRVCGDRMAAVPYGYLGTRDGDIVQRRAAQGLTKLLAEIK